MHIIHVGKLLLCLHLYVVLINKLLFVFSLVNLSCVYRVPAREFKMNRRKRFFFPAVQIPNKVFLANTYNTLIYTFPSSHCIYR